MFGFGGLFNDGFNPRAGFSHQYRCFSVSMMAGNERDDVEKGGKIILPPSALDVLTRLNIVYPMLFKLTNNKLSRHTHAGVLEFVADEGKCYLPHWMMQNLLLEEGDLVNVTNTTLPVATFCKFQPQQTEFLDISNPKAVLENVLRTFACLTKGDAVQFKYLGKTFELNVLECKPQDAVSIIECDMQVDFAPPIDYVEPDYKPKLSESKEEELDPSTLDIPAEYIQGAIPMFPGAGNRVDGKKKKNRDSLDSKSGGAGSTGLDADGKQKPPAILKRGIPDLKYKVGTIVFKRRTLKPVSNEEEKENQDNFEAFGGSGQSLRKKK